MNLIVAKDVNGGRMPKAVRDPLVGRVLSGRFELIVPMAISPRDRLYRAIQRPLGRDVAVRVLDQRHVDDAGRERFLLKALLTAKLRHPNTQAIYDYGQTDEGLCFVVMELVEGHSLKDVLATRGRLPWTQALAVAAQVGRSLREAHELGVVHGALTPASVIVGRERAAGEMVKVCDFGLVKPSGRGPNQAPDAIAASACATTPHADAVLYAAPELIHCELSPRADLYSLGAVLFRALSGRTPLLDVRPAGPEAERVCRSVADLRSHCDAPASVAALVAKCLERAPDARFRDMDALLDAIQAIEGPDGAGGYFLDCLPKPIAPCFVDGTTEPLAMLPEPEDFEGLENAQPAAAAEAVVDAPTPLVSVERPAAQAPPPAAAPGAKARMAPPPLPVAPAVAHGRPHRSARRRWEFSGRVVLSAAVLGAACSALAAALIASHDEAAAAAEALAVAEAAPSELVLDITSEPPGALVLRGVDRVGVTPMRLSVPWEGEAPMRVDLALLLEGYEPMMLVAEGAGGIVPVHEALVPLREGAEAKMPSAPPSVAAAAPESRTPMVDVTRGGVGATRSVLHPAKSAPVGRVRGPHR